MKKPDSGVNAGTGWVEQLWTRALVKSPAGTEPVTHYRPYLSHDVATET